MTQVPMRPAGLSACLTDSTRPTAADPGSVCLPDRSTRPTAAGTGSVCLSHRSTRPTAAGTGSPRHTRRATRSARSRRTSTRSSCGFGSGSTVTPTTTRCAPATRVPCSHRAPAHHYGLQQPPICASCRCSQPRADARAVPSSAWFGTVAVLWRRCCRLGFILNPEWRVQVLPEAPAELVAELSRRYIMLYEKITGLEFRPPPDEPRAERIARNVAEALAALK
jgi:hypothetical protein